MFLKNYHNYKEISLKENSDTYLELLLLTIRGETIKFATFFKKQTCAKEKQLISDIENLENTTDISKAKLDILSDKKN